MTEQIPNPDQPQPEEPTPTPSPVTPPPPANGDWREQRQAARMERREARRQRYGSHLSGWFGGAILILIGVIFLLENLGYPVWFNWWALFLLIPALWFFVAAWKLYQSNHRLTRGSILLLAVGSLITFLAIIFLLNLALSMYWPVLIIVGGLILISSALIPR